ncbi:HDOD domain protein [Roseimaritima multifibrata]|uniref:HDOD domain protein n=1 Tax=Roseimaritima multifibrata TaxID=1930274 RepID=A0A517MNU7_9BACT|nr:HDOD domain-containing protein [Roseimaritima multifibrata]QDS96558.1 HDOD domain protein [Roseimaritima multifibrata]
MTALRPVPFIAPDFPVAVEDAILKIRNLATLPAIANKIMAMATDPDCSVEDIHAIVSRDPALGARLLKLANSAFYGAPRQIDSLNQAVVMLGMNAVKNTAIAASLQKVFQAKSADSKFDASKLWLHSIAVAIAARQLAQASGMEKPETAFLAGLLHDIGIMVEMQAFGIQFIQWIHSLPPENEFSLLAAEASAFGATHQEFGAGLCRKWNFPISLENATRYHHAPQELPTELRPLPSIVHIANFMAVQMQAEFIRSMDNTSLDPEIVASIGLDLQDIENLYCTLPEEITEAQEMLA